MFNETQEPTLANDLHKNSSLYRELQARAEKMVEDNCNESIRVEYDVGFERSLADWLIKHRSNWRKGQQQQAS